MGRYIPPQKIRLELTEAEARVLMEALDNHREISTDKDLATAGRVIARLGAAMLSKKQAKTGR